MDGHFIRHSILVSDFNVRSVLKKTYYFVSFPKLISVEIIIEFEFDLGSHRSWWSPIDDPCRH